MEAKKSRIIRNENSLNKTEKTVRNEYSFFGLIIYFINWLFKNKNKEKEAEKLKKAARSVGVEYGCIDEEYDKKKNDKIHKRIKNAF